MLRDLPDEIDISQNKLENKTFEIQKIISEFEYRLHGYMWKENGNKLSYDGNALAGEVVIQKIILLLHSFSKEIIMISNKKSETWAKQQFLTGITIVEILTKEQESIASNYKAIVISCFNTLKNIGDVICNDNSKDVLKSFFGIGKEQMLQPLRKEAIF